MTVLHYEPIRGRIEEIIQHILDTPELQKYPERVFVFHLLAEELVTNIVNYAYPAHADGGMTIEIEDSGECVAMTFKDHGTPFDPLCVAAPDTTLPIAERPLGGLGIFLVKKMADEVSYKHENGMNILKVVLHCHSGV